MKRLHLFEFEDLSWFPNWLRICVTRLIVVMHKFLNSPEDLAYLIKKALDHSGRQKIVDLCSGSGGPMIEVFKNLAGKQGIENLELTLTDLYPNLEMAAEINNKSIPALTYKTTPVNAADVNAELTGVRTMVGSFHHMKPETARQILKNARDSNEAICIYEISDNSFPTYLWWLSIPVIFLMVLFITPFVRPVTWKQLVFTYLIPVIPFFFAWDGAVSNVRTYTLQDLDILIDGLQTENYRWEKGTITKKGKKLYLLGMPIKNIR